MKIYNKLADIDETKYLVNHLEAYGWLTLMKLYLVNRLEAYGWPTLMKLYLVNHDAVVLDETIKLNPEVGALR